MDLGVIMILWIFMSSYMIWINLGELGGVSMPRMVIAIVLLTIGAPVFFLSDFLEMALDYIVGEEEE